MRVRLSHEARLNLFSQLDRRGFDCQQIAKHVGFSRRHVFDWKRGQHTIPYHVFNQMVKIANIDESSLRAEILDDWWSNGVSGTKGALVRMQLYGSIGTPEGRRLGGMNSYKKRKNKKLDIFTPNKILRPRKSKQLAEMIGILIGDGGVTRYQVTVTTNSLVDSEYAMFVAELFERLFGLKPTIDVCTTANFTDIRVSSIKLVKYLARKGVKQGNKLKQGLDIPTWILGKNSFKIACLRGIFDTDGGVYQERHNINGKIYGYTRLAFVSASPDLRRTIHQVLTEMDFNPKMRNNRSVNLEKNIDVSRYFAVIGTSNPKHLRRFREFGGVG